MDVNLLNLMLFKPTPFEGIKTGFGGVCYHYARWCVETEVSIPRPLGRGLGVLFVQAWVHVDNKPRQTGLITI